MNIDILTLFPDMIRGVTEASILGRAARSGRIHFNVINIRDYTLNKHKKTDDTSYGGGAGMVMTPQPVFDALRAAEAGRKRVVYMSPKGRIADQALIEELAAEPELVFLCGHYEGIDERILDYWKPDEVSIGDYILTGGELPALVLIDAVARMIPGVLGNADSAMGESVYSGLLEYPHYTKPREFEGMDVPEILLSGNHEAIRLWQFEQSCRVTRERRPDLWQAYLEKALEQPPGKPERKILAELSGDRRFLQKKKRRD
ncbi:MAG: tRNA (guanosine(37)-N1)-methyltransferase TrmD [Firmicutes bacterium]|nr:tRNA (guanosine(37)-N1)-methyltransferase TrmD [Bacillota bacterium]